jgi:hypothetical protein
MARASISVIAGSYAKVSAERTTLCTIGHSCGQSVSGRGVSYLFRGIGIAGATGVMPVTLDGLHSGASQPRLASAGR